jgi:hypothetical protein
MTVREFRTTVGETKIFSVDFIKKDGSLRTMIARLGVKKHLQGGTLKYNAEEKSLLPVFDMEKQAYRMVNVSTIQEIRYNGEVINLED